MHSLRQEDFVSLQKKHFYHFINDPFLLNKEKIIPQVKLEVVHLSFRYRNNLFDK